MAVERIWLWKNSLGGKPEFVAYDSPWPIGVDHGDPLTLGEPAGWAYLKPCRDGSDGRTVEMAEAGCVRASRPAPKADSALAVELRDILAAQKSHCDWTHDKAVAGFMEANGATILAALSDRDVVLEEARAQEAHNG